MIKSLLLLALLVIVTAACPAGAADGPTLLSWGNCAGEPGSTGAIDVTCDGSTHTLFASFALTTAVDSARGLDASLELVFPAYRTPDVPKAWEFFPSGCAEGRVAVTPIRNNSCASFATDLCAEDTSACQASFVYLIRPFNPSRALLQVTILRPLSNTTHLSSLPVRQFAFALSIQMASDNPCPNPDCETPVTIVWNDGFIYEKESPTSSRIARVLSSTDPGAIPCASVNGGGQYCGAVPVKTSTWGRLKAAYR